MMVHAHVCVLSLGAASAVMAEEKDQGPAVQRTVKLTLG